MGVAEVLDETILKQPNTWKLFSLFLLNIWSVFADYVTVAKFVSQNNETAAILMLWESNSFHM